MILYCRSIYQEEFNRQYLERSNSTMEILYSFLKEKWNKSYEEVHPISMCN